MIVTTKTHKRDRDGLHKRPNTSAGIWYFYYRGQDGKWHEKSARTTSYSQAREVRTSELNRLQEGKQSSALADWTLGEAAKLWMAQKRPIVLPVTFDGYRWILRPLVQLLGGKKLKEISSALVRAYQSERAQWASARTVNREIQTLAAILTQAHLGANISEIKALRRTTRNIGRALTEEEEARLFAQAASKSESKTILSLVLLAANTGLRSGELKRLRIRDICWESASIYVRRSGTKTDAGERIIPLNEDACRAAEFLVQRATFLGASSADHFLLPSDCSKHTKGSLPVCSGYDPTAHQRSWRTAWRTLTRMSGLRGLRFHDLRHHFVTKLAEANVSIQVTMSLVGHMSPQMTRHYTHISDRTRRNAVNAISNLLSCGPDINQQHVVKGETPNGYIENPASTGHPFNIRNPPSAPAVSD